MPSGQPVGPAGESARAATEGRDKVQNQYRRDNPSGETSGDGRCVTGALARRRRVSRVSANSRQCQRAPLGQPRGRGWGGDRRERQSVKSILNTVGTTPQARQAAMGTASRAPSQDGAASAESARARASARAR
eukprot:1632150-Pyramimonas_sp.AAC.1